MTEKKPKAASIPRRLELPVNEPTIRREGNRLVIEPGQRNSLLDLVSTWEPLDVEFPEVNDEKPDAVEL
jgi:antitoxin VapB